LAKKLGDVTHVSPLLRKVRQLSGCSEEELSEWLLKCAVGRGASHYRRTFDPVLPPDSPDLSNEELGIAMCLYHHGFNPTLIRAAAQLLSDCATNPETLARLAVMERCEPVLLHIAEAAGRLAPQQEPWASLRTHLSSRHSSRTRALPHWSRFALQTGFTPAGRGQHIEWITRDE
jgi:hypothetical protein